MKPRHGWKPLPVKGSPLISIVIATYKQTDELACLLYALRSQTYPNWEALVVHDGPWGKDAPSRTVPPFFDTRIRLIETVEHKGHWGHHHREWAISHARGEYICLTNADNYYVPVFFEWMLNEATAKHADFVHCHMVHSHKRYADFHTIPLKTKIDLGAWIGHRSIVQGTPWTDYGFAGDGTFIEAVASKAKRIVGVPAFLFVHN